jgi:basic membrane protein A and related proteins
MRLRFRTVFAGVSSVALMTAMASTESMAATKTSKPKVGLVFDIGGRGDQSFNDSAARGLDRAKAKFGLATKELEPSKGGENREQLLRLMASQNYGLVYAVGFAFADAVKAVAPSYPKVTFAQIDSVVDLPNVSSLTFAEQEGSYLVGAAAALKSTTKNIGFIGGVQVPLIQKFEAGYVAGAKSVDPNIKIQIKYISQPPDYSGFSDAAKGKEIGKSMYDDGADVVYHAAGGSGPGLFDAAVEAGDNHWAIGVDSDQYLTASSAQKPHILTSMIKRVDVAVYDTAKGFIDKKLATGEQVFNLKVNGVGYATSNKKALTPTIVAKLEILKKKIVSGTIKVPSTP